MGLKSQQKSLKEEKRVSASRLRERSVGIPENVALERELKQTNDECRELMETVKVLRLKTDIRAQYWLKKLTVLENATREIRKEMFQTVYSQKMAQMHAKNKSKNPVILKGPISEEAAKQYEENMGAKMVLPKLKPGRVLTGKDKARPSQDRHQ